MSRVLFIDLIEDFYDRHAIYSLSAFMKKHDVEVYFVRDKSYKRLLQKIAGIKPNFLLYSTVSSYMPMYIEFDRMAKENFTVKSLIGGPGPTFDWKCIEGSTIDAACVGEGEFALVDFIKGGFAGGKNIFCRGADAPSDFHNLVDLDSLPFPDRDLVYQYDSLIGDTPSKQFLSGRGCPYECTYCFNHKFMDIFKKYGPSVRKKSVDYLIEEILLVKSRYPLANVVFSDDTFILNRKWFLEFCESFPRDIGLAYTCNIRANLMDEEIVKALSRSGCIGVNWSIESGDDFLRNTVLKRRMSVEQILDTSNLLTKYRIPYRIGNVIALPGESFEQMLGTLELNIKARPSLALANIFVPFPGLELTRYAIERGYYKPDPKAGLPANLATRSVMEISLAENRNIQKLMCLFPICVSFPFLFYNSLMRKFLFCLPVCLLKMIYQTIFTFKMMKIYMIKASFFHRCRMAARYIMNI